MIVTVSWPIPISTWSNVKTDCKASTQKLCRLITFACVAHNHTNCITIQIQSCYLYAPEILLETKILNYYIWLQWSGIFRWKNLKTKRYFFTRNPDFHIMLKTCSKIRVNAATATSIIVFFVMETWLHSARIKCFRKWDIGTVLKFMFMLISNT